MYWDMLRLDHSGREFKSLLSVGAGGQAFAPSLYKDIATAFPLAVLGVGYGMTECGGTVCTIAGKELDSRVTASGRVFPSVDVRIVNEEDAEVPIGEPGEILMRGAMLMREYCKQAQATAEVLQDGWLRTGDIGRVDAEGYLHVVDRKKNIVISGGENISCNEVEAALMEHGGVAEAAAFSVPDERLGEQVVVAVVLLEGQALSEEALKAHMGERLAAYKVPRRVVFFDSLPRNATEKVLRHELRRLFLTQIDGITDTV
ncbi:Long-chain-fatty-acid--CoA ligase [compost metagenome]